MAKLAVLIASADFSKLSKKSGVDVERLRHLALGEEPTLGELRRIASALRIALEDLAAVTPSQTGAQFLFRNSHLEHNQTDVFDRLSRKIGNSLDIISPQNDAGWLHAFSPGGSSFADAENAAVLFRQLFYNNDQLSPLFDLPTVLANALNVVLFVVNANEIDGASAFFQGTAFIFVSSRFPPRMLFTVAHELGHLIAHRTEDGDFAVVDGASGERTSRDDKTQQERFAHTFASCLLMPSGGVGIALKKIRERAGVIEGPLGDAEVLFLARIFGVSFEAAARRCEDLKLLPRGGGASLNAELKKRYGSAEKRAEELGLPPRADLRFPIVPDHLLRSAVSRIRAGDLSVGRAASILGISVGDLISANAPTAH